MNMICNIPSTPEQRGERVARLTRHLEARLLDFGPGGPEVVEAHQEEGFVTARFPGHDTAAVLRALEEAEVLVAQEGELACFFLTPDLPFEGLDYIWGALFDIL